jgi:hypothetical protein
MNRKAGCLTQNKLGFDNLVCGTGDARTNS